MGIRTHAVTFYGAYIQLDDIFTPLVKDKDYRIKTVQLTI